MKKLVKGKKKSTGIVRAHPRKGSKGVNAHYRRGKPGKLRAESVAPTKVLRGNEGRIFGIQRA